MANPNPSPRTRFKPGKSGNPSGTSGPQRATILRALPSIRTLEEVMADARAWHGPIRMLFESIARDPDHPLDIRLHCAAVLVKNDTEDDGPQLTPVQRRRRIAELLPGLYGPQAAALVEGRVIDAEPADAVPTVPPAPGNGHGEAEAIKPTAEEMKAVARVRRQRGAPEAGPLSPGETRAIVQARVDRLEREVAEQKREQSAAAIDQMQRGVDYVPKRL